MKNLALVLFSLGILLSPAYAVERYLSPDGSDDNNGLTPATAWRTLDYAFSQMRSVGCHVTAPADIYLAAGTYAPSNGDDFPILARRNMGYFRLIGEGPDVTHIDGEGLGPQDNYYFIYSNQGNSFGGMEFEGIHFTGFEGVIQGHNFTHRLRLDNVVMDGFVGLHGNRGHSAIYMNHGYAQIEINNTTIEGADTWWDGGALYVPACDGNITITNSTFRNNNARDDGGAICIKGGVNVTMTNVLVENCSAERGSGGGIAIASVGGEVVMDSVTVNGNTAAYFGGGIFIGGIFLADISMNQIMLNGNTATAASGGGMWCGGPLLGIGGVSMSNFCVVGNTAGANGGGLSIGYNDIELINGTIYDNTAGSDSDPESRGGGINLYKPLLSVLNVSMNNLVFWQNEVRGVGGGFYVDNFASLWGGSLDVYGLVLLENKAFGLSGYAGKGGGAYIRNSRNTGGYDDDFIFRNVLLAKNEAETRGGALYLDEANPDLVNLTVSNNVSPSHPSFYYDDYSGSDVNIYNSIFWANGGPNGDQDSYSTSNVNIAYSDMETSSSSPVSGTGNIKQKPLFYKPAQSVYIRRLGSPVIDAAIPAGDSNYPSLYSNYSHEQNADQVEVVQFGPNPEDVVNIELNNRLDMGYFGGTTGGTCSCGGCGSGGGTGGGSGGSGGSGGGTVVDIPTLPGTDFVDETVGIAFNSLGEEVTGAEGEGEIGDDSMGGTVSSLPGTIVIRDRYTMMGTPVDPNQVIYQDQPRVAFGDDLNNTIPGDWSPDTTQQKWRISRYVNNYEWEEGSFYTGYLRYLEPEADGIDRGDPPPLRPGYGYWFVYNLASNTAPKIYLDIYKNTLPLEPYSLQLESAISETQASVNMMANPWSFPMDWQDVQFTTTENPEESDWVNLAAAADSGWVNQYAYTWSPEYGSYLPVTGRLDPWEGFFLAIYTTDPIWIRFAPNEADEELSQFSKMNELDEVLDWSLLFTARRTDRLQVDYHNYIGVGDEMSDLSDKFDAIQWAPLAKEAIFFRFRNQIAETGQPIDRLAYDFRSNTFDENGQKAWLTEIWFFSSSDNGDSYPIDVQVNWPTISAVPENVQLSMRTFNGYIYNAENTEVMVEDLRTTNSTVVTLENQYIEDGHPRYNYARFWTVATDMQEIQIDVPERDPDLPTVTKLAGIYPNPFNAQTTVKFDIADATNVKMAVFNVLGQQVAELTNRRYEPGYHELSWNAGRNASGVYFVRFQTSGRGVEMKKIMLIR